MRKKAESLTKKEWLKRVEREIVLLEKELKGIRNLLERGEKEENS